MSAGGGITAAHVAVAIVTASRLRGADPAGVFAGGTATRRVRILAAAGLVARLGYKKGPVAGLLRVFPQELAPSMLAKADVTTDELLEIAEALQAAGLAAGDNPSQRFTAPWRSSESDDAVGADPVRVEEDEPADRGGGGSAPPKPAPPEPSRAQAAAASGDPARKSGQAGAPDAEPVPGRIAVRPPSAPVEPQKTGLGPGLGSGSGSGAGGSFKRRASGQSGARALKRGLEAVAAETAAGRARPGSGVTTIKAVTPRIAHWAGHFLEADWPADEVADLFDVCPQALLDALDPLDDLTREVRL